MRLIRSFRPLAALSLALVMGLAGLVPLAAADQPLKIVLIGGKKSHGEGEHDFPNGIPLLNAMLKASPTFAGAQVWAYPVGFPADLTALDGATTVLLYFDGVQESPAPLLAGDRIAALDKLMAAGAGLVCLHQASTVPKDNQTIPMRAWLGARRNGMVDRTTEEVTLKPVTASHPISNGMGSVTYRDEFYPTLEFLDDPTRITAILRGSLPKDAPKERVLAWAFERPAGGRSFGFTGGHFVAGLQEPAIKQMVLNALAWTAHLTVPAAGVQTTTLVVGKAIVGQPKIVPQPWGELRWNASADKGNSATMTTGVAIIKPGQANPRHFHPNCDEILTVVSGRIRHTMNEVTVEMNPGDTVSIPTGTLHNATNIGTEDAVLSISFSSAYRQVIGE